MTPDVKIQQMMDIADNYRSESKHKEAIDAYFTVLNYWREIYSANASDELWNKKVIFMVCIGMGISKTKLGRHDLALDDFNDAIIYAPNEEARQVAQINKEKLEARLAELKN